MPNIEIIEIHTIPDYAGMKGVTKIINSECGIMHYANFKSFIKELYDVGGSSYRYNNKNGLLEFLDSDKNVLSKYRADYGFRINGRKIEDIKDNLFFFDYYFDMTHKWYRVYSDNFVSFPTMKLWSDIRTIFDGHNYYVIDNSGNYVIPPGKYDYIDGFWNGYARVMLKNKNIESPDDSGYRCGIVDLYGNIILPIEYTCIESFYHHPKRVISLHEGGLDFQKQWTSFLFHYKYDILSKQLEPIGDCMYGHYVDYTEEIPDHNDEYTIWDAFEDSEEAAAAADFEW